MAKKEEWFEKIDTTFRTLIMPVSFVMTITWSFLFQVIYIFVSENERSTVFGNFLKLFAAHLIVFIIAIFFWCWSTFVKRGRKIGPLIKREIKKGPLLIVSRPKESWLHEARFFFRFLALCFLWVSLLAIPADLIVAALAFEIGAQNALWLYSAFFIVFFGISFKLSLPPK